MDIQTVNTLIEKSDKLNSLYKELKESLIYEKCKYHLVDYKGPQGRFILFEISTGLEVKEGTILNILNWLNRRKIDINLVYNNKYLNK